MELPHDLAELPTGDTVANALATDALSAEIFVVDDERSELSMMEMGLEGAGLRVRTFISPVDALEEAAERRPAVVITDLNMPGMSGIELGTAVLEVDPEAKIILLTGGGGEAAAQEALRLGVSDYITKPPDLAELLAAVRRAVLDRAADVHHRKVVGWMREELKRREGIIRDLTLQALSALVNAQDARSPHFLGHSRGVTLQAGAIAETLGMDEAEVETVRTAGMLHDVGMIAVPDKIVQKPGALSAAEYAIVRDHCVKGVEIIEPLEHLGPATRFVQEHHERWDGAGYPHGRKGSEISVGGQILGIAEAWTSLLSSRPYRPRMSRDDAEVIMRDRAGEWFSADMVKALFASDVGLL